MKEKNQNENEKEIDEFIYLCRCNDNFKHGSSYFNAIKLYFENVIDTEIIHQAIKNNFKFFVGRCYVDHKLIYLFIYKKEKNYEYN